MPQAFYYVFAAIGFVVFSVFDGKYAHLAWTMFGIYMALAVIWAAIDLHEHRPVRVRA